ncbi:hypothetical protein HHL22_19720 [Hymenobacter sp. RP-2-7]|uniref:Uncharacterized protein n=1 Tax=Hymenobacter polaris TaxID=2682546 RepID=A0A7Y0FNX7_9BACT|nr:hypothetical protein [Hymenobacter polaris]NML67437.1 hypothetical protein [Hymenobacter polaris]
MKRDVVTVDGQPYLKFESDGYTSLYISSLQNERLLVVKEMELSDPALRQTGSINNAHLYLQYVFLKSRTIVETPRPSVFSSLPVMVARTLYAARLLQNGGVSQPALDEFALVNGTVYTERRQALNQAGWLTPAVIGAPAISPPQSPRTPRP